MVNYSTKNIICTYASHNNKVKRNMNSNKKRKQKGNKSKEVQYWDDLPETKPQMGIIYENGNENGNNKSKTETKKGYWVKGTVHPSIIKCMPWGDLNELTDEEFGYYVQYK